jgi:hypothetical protein
VSKIHGNFGLQCLRIGTVIKQFFKQLNASSHSLVHGNFGLFLSDPRKQLVNGLQIHKYPKINFR